MYWEKLYDVKYVQVKTETQPIILEFSCTM